MNIRKSIGMGILTVLLVGMMAFVLPSGSVAAQAPTPPTQKDPLAQEARINARLEKAFAALQKMVEKQAQHLERAEAFVGKAEGWISKAKANGKDTAALEAAVTAFKSKEAEAKKLNGTAANIVKTHAGFDANGKVVNRDQARQTLQDGNQPLKEARGVFGEALKNLHETFKAWREANPLKPQK